MSTVYDVPADVLINHLAEEFKNNNDIIARQITYISKIDKIKGYYIFSYSQLSSENAKDEVSNMYEVMQSNSQG